MNFPISFFGFRVCAADLRGLPFERVAKTRRKLMEVLYIYSVYTEMLPFQVGWSLLIVR